MSPDDIDSVALAVFDLMVGDLGCSLDDDDWLELLNLLHTKLEPFITGVRNYN